MIDMHVHCGVLGNFEMPYTMVEQFLDKYLPDHIILSNCEACENTEELTPLPPELVRSQNQCFRDTIIFARKHPGKISVMPWIKPSTDGVDNEFIELIEQNSDIVKGIKFHAHNSNLPSDSPLLEPYWDIAKTYSLPILIHTGGVPAASPVHVYEAAKKHPDVNFIMAHMELGTDNRNAIDLIAQLPNLYGDTAWVPIHSVLYFLETCSSDRILFGTDTPIDGFDTYDTNKTGDPSLYLQYFHELPQLVSPEIYHKIMHQNSKDLFHLDL